MDGAASTATAPPREADPPEAVAHEYGVGFTEPNGPHDDVVPRAVVRHEGDQSYAWCSCGFSTGYCESDAQASRIAALHSRKAHGG